jgi:hypothetical protein
MNNPDAYIDHLETLLAQADLALDALDIHNNGHCAYCGASDSHRLACMLAVTRSRIKDALKLSLTEDKGHE